MNAITGAGEAGAAAPAPPIAAAYAAGGGTYARSAPLAAPLDWGAAGRSFLSVMSSAARTVELSADLHAFAEERVRSGAGASVADVVREAVEEKRHAVLCAAIDAGLAELEAGLGVECTADELVGEALAEAGLDRR